MTDTIDKFWHEYRFLSNFFESPVTLDGTQYPTVEHAFQAAKTNDWEQRKTIFDAETPGEAKRLGKTVTLRPDWEDVKINVMTKLNRQKYLRKDLREKLIATNPKYLIEGNTWGDKFWGVCDGEGLNHLGLILMKIREEVIREESNVKE